MRTEIQGEIVGKLIAFGFKATRSAAGITESAVVVYANFWANLVRIFAATVGRNLRSEFIDCARIEGCDYTDFQAVAAIRGSIIGRRKIVCERGSIGQRAELFAAKSRVRRLAMRLGHLFLAK